VTNASTPPDGGCPRASEPVPLPTLVHAGTRRNRRPQDAVRAQDTGRGRQSQPRGQCLGPTPATLSRIPSPRDYRLPRGRGGDTSPIERSPGCSRLTAVPPGRLEPPPATVPARAGI